MFSSVSRWWRGTVPEDQNVLPSSAETSLDASAEVPIDGPNVSQVPPVSQVSPAPQAPPPLDTCKEEIVTVPRLDLSNIRDSPIIVVMGCRATGKSVLCRELLKKLPVDEKIVVSVTEHMCPFYTRMSGLENVYHGLKEDPQNYSCSPDDLPSFDLKKYLQDKRMYSSKTSSLIVLDDLDGLAGPTGIKKNREVQRIFNEGRHYKTGLVVTQQYSCLPPALRGNTDYVFIFSITENDLRKIYESWGGQFSSFNLFRTIYNKCTSVEHGCLFLDLAENKMFHYKVPMQ
jgi:hypothetical protein